MTTKQITNDRSKCVLQELCLKKKQREILIKMFVKMDLLNVINAPLTKNYNEREKNINKSRRQCAVNVMKQLKKKRKTF